MTGVALPEGYSLDTGAVALPEGYSAAPTPPTGIGAVAANAATGLMSGVGNLFGLPNTLANFSEAIREHLGIPQEGLLGLGGPARAQWVAKHTYSPEEINSATVYPAANAVSEAAGGQPIFPYQPTTAWGAVGQHLLGNVIPAAVGGLEGLGAREAAGAGGTLASDLYGYARPDDFWGRIAAGGLGAGAGLGVARVGGSLTNAVARHFVPERIAGQQVAQQLADAAGMSGPQLVNTIENAPAWTPGAKPTLGALTGNTGIRNMEYIDQAAASRAGDVTYQTNARSTNEAQRMAVAAVTPDTAQTINQLMADRDAAVNAIPPGVPAQDAGLQLRAALQQVRDQRVAARAAGGTMFDALENSPAQINLRPVMDYATEQAAKNAGIVGDAYKAALSQFRSGTGITLDTAPFANSVLKGLGDLQASYPAGSAAARAVGDIKARVEGLITDPVTGAPEVAAARATWAQNSRPLDVFESKPFAQVLATDRFGRSYAMPNDAVAAAFLRGNGSADALDALNKVFGDPEASTQALQDYIAGQVRQSALKADGSIDPAALQRTLQPYQAALMRFPTLAAKFKTLAGAQDALDQQMAYQRIYDTFRNGLGTMEQDAAGNPMYSPAQFDRAVQQHQGDLVAAYGPQGAQVINRVNDELKSITQTAYAKVKGQSGTPQALALEGKAVSRVGPLTGSILGTVLEHVLGSHSAAGAIIGARVGEAVGHFFGQGNEALAKAVDGIRRQALTDPVYARDLLAKYQPKMPTSLMQQRMQYVLQRTPMLTLPAPTAPVTPQLYPPAP